MLSNIKIWTNNVNCILPLSGLKPTDAVNINFINQQLFVYAKRFRYTSWAINIDYELNSFFNIINTNIYKYSWSKPLKTPFKFKSAKNFNLRLSAQVYTYSIDSSSNAFISSINKYTFNSNYDLINIISLYRNNIINNFKNDSYLVYTKYLYNTIRVKYLYKQQTAVNTNVKDVYFKRYRFTPGYMSFWRRARLFYKNINQLNFRYQKKLTNYLKNMKILNTYLLNINCFSLTLILYNTQLCYSYEVIYLLLNKGAIFLNNTVCKKNILVSFGDYICVRISWKYYILYFFKADWINQLDLIFEKKFLRYLKSQIPKSFEKTPKMRFSKKLFSFTLYWIFFFTKIEVDFLVLSCCLIHWDYTHIVFNQLKLYFFNKIGITKLYNWKYIT